MVYYRYLFLHMEDLSPYEGIVYSELVFNSIISNPHYRTGKLMYVDRAKYDVENLHILGWTEDIDYYPLKVKELVKMTEMSLPTIKKILISLEEKKYIDGKYIRCPFEMLKHGYVKIPLKTGLRGRQLIFYGLLLDRSRKYKGTIDTMAYKLGELCGIENKNNVYFIINQIKEKGLVERTKSGKLLIKKPSKENKKEETSTASSK